ncbi:MAG: DUF6429 family protein [Thainema sp.]
MNYSDEDDTQYDHEKLDEVALALIYLNILETGNAWKGVPRSATDRLHDKGYLFHPGSKEKSFTLTDKGRVRAKELFLKHFTDAKISLTNFSKAVVFEQNNEKDYVLNTSLYELERAFENTNWKTKYFLNLETGEIEASFPSALVGGIWLTIPGYTSGKQSRSEEEAQEILTWLKVNRITLVDEDNLE